MQDTLFAPDIALPPSEWKDSSSWQFDSFAMHLCEDVCTNCSAIHHYSSVFRMFVRKYPAATDRRLVLASSVNRSLKLVTFKLPVRLVPLCHICATDSAGTLTVLVSSEQEWNYAQQRDREARANSKRASPSSREPVVLAPLKDLL